MDNTVAGGMSLDEQPLECLAREAGEEASLPENLILKNAKACGTVSYFYVRDDRAGGEVGLLQPEIQYVYDLQLSDDISPVPCDGEAEDFYLWSLQEVKTSLANAEFKPNCALVLIDFLIRYGHITAEQDSHFEEIIPRLHRNLSFPSYS